MIHLSVTDVARDIDAVAVALATNQPGFVERVKAGANKYVRFSARR